MKNSQQKRLARAKKKRHDDRALMRKKDIVVTYIYDLIIDKVIVPAIKRNFGFGPVRMERFKMNLSKIEVYSGMARANEATKVVHEKIKKQRLSPKSYTLVWGYVMEEARDALGLLGYGEKRLGRGFDPVTKKIVSWDELFKNE